MRNATILGLWGGVMIAAAAILIVVTAAPAGAQTVAIGTFTSDVDLNRGGNVTARVARTANPDTQGAIDKFLHGAVRVTAAHGGSPTVAIDWHSLSSDPAGADAVQLAPAMSSLQAATGATLKSGQEIPVAGDAAALIRAARSIVETQAAAADTNADDEEAETPAVTAADGSVTTGGAGAPLETEEAKLPTIQGVTATETVESVVQSDVYGETTEGCTPELSEDETYVTILKAATTNGKKTGDCEASLETATVQETFIGCGYDTATSDTTAYATKRRYYVYGGSTTDIDTECVVDDETSFAIVESPDGCQIVPDLELGTAKQHTARVFIGRQNERVTVDGCAAREGGTEFPITFELCSYRDDFPNKLTYETHIAKYQGPDGLKRNIGNCTDTGKTYAHFEDTSVCEPLLDLTANKLFEQFRIRIDLPNGISYRTPSCKPFPSALTNLLETQAGCETFHQDYAGYSLGGKRIIRQDNQAQVRGCQVADLRYEHVYVPEGWLYDDVNLSAKPKDATYIDLPQPAGRTLVAAAVVRDGVAGVPYVFQRSFSQDGNQEYVPDSCDRYLQQKKMMEYKRPDGTRYVVQDGFNDPIGPTWDCRYEVSSTWTRNAPSSMPHAYSEDGTCGRYWDGERWINRGVHKASSSYLGVRKTIRGDGLVIAEQQGQGSYSNCSVHCGITLRQWSGANNCPATVTSHSLIGPWMTNLGW